MQSNVDVRYSLATRSRSTYYGVALIVPYTYCMQGPPAVIDDNIYARNEERTLAGVYVSAPPSTYAGVFLALGTYLFGEFVSRSTQHKLKVVRKDSI